jgi:hypothetical protein
MTHPQLLYASGFLFMGATEEQMRAVAALGMDHVAYILILYSLAFMVFLFSMMLIGLYERCATPTIPVKNIESGRIGGTRTNGHAVPMRDAQEFELEGLMSDDEDARELDDDRGLESPGSTVGKNSDGVAR